MKTACVYRALAIKTDGYPYYFKCQLNNHECHYADQLRCLNYRHEPGPIPCYDGTKCVQNSKEACNLCLITPSKNKIEAKIITD